ncbi:hypothetical protein MTR_7g110730 [Medicago truncatula]|uniref:Uncharacterized protein n=1 Tax=Medicago truncatula TaxID=3880 RepID=G7KUN0_MEDTR|nr:hypothetical protein MTR_7g110730 [Medicago truncatula]
MVESVEYHRPSTDLDGSFHIEPFIYKMNGDERKGVRRCCFELDYALMSNEICQLDGQ